MFPSLSYCAASCQLLCCPSSKADGLKLTVWRRNYNNPGEAAVLMVRETEAVVKVRQWSYFGGEATKILKIFIDVMGKSSKEGRPSHN